jgi:DNA-binding LytR/AlgR family response regulator
MDIRMPYLNGMETAKKLRELDEQCALIFVTNMAKYAIAGYEVNALYFMVKPIVYEDFCFKMKKVVAYVQRRRETTVFVKTAEGIVKLDVDDIYFIEVLSHRLSYHTVQGIFQTWDTLSHVEESLSGQSFARCNVSYLVNLRHVTEVSNNYVLVGGEQLKISAPKKKSFLDALTKSISGGT